MRLQTSYWNLNKEMQVYMELYPVELWEMNDITGNLVT